MAGPVAHPLGARAREHDPRRDDDVLGELFQGLEVVKQRLLDEARQGNARARTSRSMRSFVSVETKAEI